MEIPTLNRRWCPSFAGWLASMLVTALVVGCTLVLRGQVRYTGGSSRLA